MSAWIFGMVCFALIAAVIIRIAHPRKPKGFSRETERFLQGLRHEQEQKRRDRCN